MKNTLGTLIYTRLRGERVGEDSFGNTYYRDPQSRFTPGIMASKEKRWVVYAGEAEATRVPPAWHAWLHYMVDTPPSEGGAPDPQSWEKPHQPNATMTAEAYRPPGHSLRGGKRARGGGDYEPWTPA